MNLYRAKCSIPKEDPTATPHEFVDWYEADNLETARELFNKDCRRNGLPLDKLTVEFAQHDPQTLKPI